MLGKPAELVAETTREEVENYLYADAALLDAWRLEEWLAGMSPTVNYVIPATDMHNVPGNPDLAIVSDDRRMLEGRILRLLSQRAHCEHPFSRTRRLVTNVRIGGRLGDHLEVQANFAIYRFRRTAETQYVGRYEICLDVRGPREFVMTHRSAILDHYDLADSGVVSIIL